MRKLTRKPKRIRKRKSIWRYPFFRLVLFFFLLLIEIFYLLIFSPLFQIKEIKIVAPPGIPVLTLQKLFELETKKKLLFFSTKSIFLFKAKKVEQIILEKFTQIKKIEIKRIWPASLFVEIEERQPVAQWCEDQEGQCFLIDKEGVLFQKLPAFWTAEKEISPIFFNLQKEKEANLGKKVLDKEEFASIWQIYTRLNEGLKIKTKEFMISSDKFTAKTEQGTEIYFALTADVSRQLFNLEVLLEKEVNLQVEPVEYIDLRFDNRVFYFPKSR